MLVSKITAFQKQRAISGFVSHVLLVLAALIFTASISARAESVAKEGRWIATWGASPFAFLSFNNAPPPVTFQNQTVRQDVRISGEFDAVIEFDQALQDPADPDRMAPAYDSGDKLHPGDAGYKRKADSIDLSLFE